MKTRVLLLLLTLLALPLSALGARKLPSAMMEVVDDAYRVNDKGMRPTWEIYQTLENGLTALSGSEDIGKADWLHLLYDAITYGRSEIVQVVSDNNLSPFSRNDRLTDEEWTDLFYHAFAFQPVDPTSFRSLLQRQEVKDFLWKKNLFFALSSLFVMGKDQGKKLIPGCEEVMAVLRAETNEKSKSRIQAMLTFFLYKGWLSLDSNDLKEGDREFSRQFWFKTYESLDPDLRLLLLHAQFYRKDDPLTGLELLKHLDVIPWKEADITAWLEALSAQDFTGVSEDMEDFRLLILEKYNSLNKVEPAILAGGAFTRVQIFLPAIFLRRWMETLEDPHPLLDAQALKSAALLKVNKVFGLNFTELEWQNILGEKEWGNILLEHNGREIVARRSAPSWVFSDGQIIWGMSAIMTVSAIYWGVLAPKSPLFKWWRQWRADRLRMDLMATGVAVAGAAALAAAQQEELMSTTARRLGQVVESFQWDEHGSSSAIAQLQGQLLGALPSGVMGHVGGTLHEQLNLKLVGVGIEDTNRFWSELARLASAQAKPVIDAYLSYVRHVHASGNKRDGFRKALTSFLIKKSAPH